MNDLSGLPHMTALKRQDVPGFTPRTLDVASQLSATRKPLAARTLGSLSVQVLPGRDTLWIVVRRPGKGGVALKTARSPGPVKVRQAKGGNEWECDSESGRFLVKLGILSDTLLRVTVTLTPATDLLVPFWSRDLYPLDANDNPTRAKGRVEAAQRGLNSGLCYFLLDKPAFGSVLYVQNLTALNAYFAATKTKPDGVVGGEWPELGYQPPTAPMGSSPPTNPLPKGAEIVISDALISFRDAYDLDEPKSAVQFIEMLAEIYPHLDRPAPGHHDWAARAEKTLRHLQKSPQCVIQHYGHTYLHPYTEAEYPDSMVQMAVVSSIRDYEAAFAKDIPFADDLAAGMPRFFDKKIGSLRRYLPNVGKDKNANAVDSWYLYHPLLNLGRLALRGDKLARRLFLDSMDYATRAAHHFKYEWPIQYDVRNFAVIKASRNEETGLGQTDVGGIYAYVMLQAFDLTGDKQFLVEAKAALRALEGIRFELVYQANLTAWGAVACVRLWQMEKKPAYLEQAYVFIAGFIHNCELWDSQIEHAKHYTNFFGATCLHDAPYMSAYECYESFAAFDDLLRIAGDTLPDPVRLLLLEYRRFALDRAWYFYPDALPSEAIQQDEIRNGYIDRRLSIPLEDVYGDGQPAGKVGQEIYGSGGAFVFASRAFHERRGAPFRIFTDYPAVVEPAGRGKLAVRLQLPNGYPGKIVIRRKGKRPLPRLSLRSEANEDVLPAVRRSPDCAEYDAPPAADRFVVSWSTPAARR
jgi:hypothetical protein